MPKKSDAEIVLIRFDDIQRKADETRAELDRLLEAMRTLEVMGAQDVPPAYLEAWTGALYTVRAAVEMVEGARGIAAENAVLHKALQDRQLVTYPGPVQ